MEALISYNDKPDMILVIVHKDIDFLERKKLAKFKWRCAACGVLTQFAEERDVTQTYNEYGRVLRQMTLMMGVKIDVYSLCHSVQAISSTSIHVNFYLLNTLFIWFASGNIPWMVPLPDDEIMSIGHATDFNSSNGLNRLFSSIVATTNRGHDHKFHFLYSYDWVRSEEQGKQYFLGEVMWTLNLYRDQHRQYPATIVIYRRYDTNVPHDQEAEYLREQLPQELDIVFIVVKTTESTRSFGDEVDRADSGLVIRTSRFLSHLSLSKPRI